MTHSDTPSSKSTSSDLVVLGATPAGIAAAVTAAREGLTVTLVSTRPHIGGMMTSGLGGMDHLYDRPRSPLMTEFMESVRRHYASTYGKNSPQYAACDRPRPGRFRYESRVAEKIFESWVAIRGLTVLRSYRPVAVERSGREILSLIVKPIPDGGEGVKLLGRTFVDATYEGDLASIAGAEYRLGREGRDEFGEPHAGRILTIRDKVALAHGEGFPREAAAGRLNLTIFPATTQEVFAGSTGEGDKAIQAYNYRLCLTNDPTNRLPIQKPSGYDPTRYEGILEKESETLGKNYTLQSQLLLADPEDLIMDPARWGAQLHPNSKMSFNEGNCPGKSHRYPEASWDERAEIERYHLEHALGLLYFLQHDERLPSHVRESALQWGLAADEFVDNNHLPYEMYVREARRIVGRYTFTEHDGCLAPGLERAPIHQDSIGIAAWPLDSHECTSERVLGSLCEGEFLLTEKTRPSQIPYRCLVPSGLDNLLVPVCLSSTHVGWGTLRVEPTWIPLGEVAGLAAARGHARRASVADLDVSALQHDLLERGFVISFFNDLDPGKDDTHSHAIQWLATRGFFSDYNALSSAPLGTQMANIWIEGAGALLEQAIEPSQLARRVSGITKGDQATTIGHFVDRLNSTLQTRTHYEPMPRPENARETISRGEACFALYTAMTKALRQGD